MVKTSPYTIVPKFGKYLYVWCPCQDNKDLELELIPNSLSDSDPEVNLSDPSHQVSDEKRRSARKKE